MKSTMKKKVSKIVEMKINEKLTSLMEELSTNEFVDEICDIVFDELETDVESNGREEVTEIIGGKVFPLIHKLTEYVIGKEIKLNYE
jgi:hypothetical protein